jgi:hypothetical protein
MINSWHSRSSTEAGRQIDFNDEQPESGELSIRRSFEPGSNSDDEGHLHSERAHSSRSSTQGERRIDRNDERRAKAFESVRLGFDSVSDIETADVEIRYYRTL